jgi:DNA-binding GntR family transcriptional regulator
VTKAIDRLKSAGWVTTAVDTPWLRFILPAQGHRIDKIEFISPTALTSGCSSGSARSRRYYREQIAQLLGVNPATIRRAAEWLRNDGLLTFLPRRGWQVSVVAAQDLRDVFQIRILLEPLALETAVHRISDDAIDSLEKETQRLIGLGEQPGAFDRRDADHRFHRTLAEASGNPILATTLEPLIRRALLVTTVGFPYGRSLRSYEEHHEILTALRRRDLGMAKKAMADHLQNALKFGIAMWERS